MRDSTDKIPDYENFLISTSKEIMAVKDRVRFLINDANWAEEGRYKEIILREILRSFLPERYGIGTGFVICKGNKVTSQIDIIIYDKFNKNSNAEMLKKGEFVIVDDKSVVGIIEVKSSFDSHIFSPSNNRGENAITKILANKRLIGNKIFAGIFAFNLKVGIESVSENLKDILCANSTKLDCISFDKNHFMKFWEAGMPDVYGEKPKFPHYSFYEFIEKITRKEIDCAFGYFISNIVEHLKIWLTKKPLSEDEIKRLYPLLGGKEQYRKESCEIILGNGR